MRIHVFRPRSAMPIGALEKVRRRGIRFPDLFSKKRPHSAADREREVYRRLRAALFALLDRNFESAEEELTEAVRADSNALDATVALARFYRERGEVGRAIRVHQNLLLRRDLDADHRVQLLIELARDFERGGYVDRAIASYEEVLEDAPKNGSALRALLDLYIDARSFNQAISVAKRLARIERRKDPLLESRLRVGLAETHREEGRSDLARRALKTALRKAPKNAEAHRQLGELEAERGRDKAALAAWCRAAQLDRTLAQTLYPTIESAFASTGKSRDVEIFFRELIDADGEDSGAVIALARHLNSRGDVDLAKAELKRWIEVRSDDLAARVLLGKFLLAAHRDTEAVEEYRSLLDRLERHPRLLEPEKSV